MHLKKQTKPTLVELVMASDFRNSDISRHYGNLDMATAMNSTGKTIGRLARLGDDKFVYQLGKLFRGMSIYFGEEMSQDAAETVVLDILGDYELSNLKLEDLVVIGKELKAADINRNRLTPNHVLRHVRGYWKRRVEAATRNSVNDSLTHKHNDSVDITERMKKTIALPDAQGKRVDRTRADVKKYYK